MNYTADLHDGTYLNPIFNGDYPDPAVVRVNEDYYLTTSCGNHYPALTIFHSRDLVTWEPVCNPLTGFDESIMAPDFIYYDNKFYIYFCTAETNWVIWSHNVDWGWSRAIDLRVGYIDPGHCADDEGNRYLFLSAGHMIRLSRDGLSTVGDLETVMDIPSPPEEWEIEGHFPESPKLTKRGGYHYLTYANAGTAGPATSHGVFSARARHPLGPWEFSPHQPLLRTKSRDETWHSKGHGHLVDDIRGDWWIIYHAYEKDYHNQGRKLLLEPIEWGEDGWPRTVEGVQCHRPIRKPAGSPIPSGMALSDDFSGSGFPLWKCEGDADNTRYQISDGALSMKGMGNCVGESMPLLITVGDHSWTAETKVEVSKGCEAGLILSYSSQFYNGISLKNGVISLYRNGQSFPNTHTQVNTDTLFLRMVNNRHYVTCYYSLNGTKYSKLNFTINVQSQDQNAYGGFGGLWPGVFAAGKGSAKFSYFHYTPEAL